MGLVGDTKLSQPRLLYSNYSPVDSLFWVIPVGNTEHASKDVKERIFDVQGKQSLTGKRV